MSSDRVVSKQEFEHLWDSVSDFSFRDPIKLWDSFQVWSRTGGWGVEKGWYLGNKNNVFPGLLYTTVFEQWVSKTKERVYDIPVMLPLTMLKQLTHTVYAFGALQSARESYYLSPTFVKANKMHGTKQEPYS